MIAGYQPLIAICTTARRPCFRADQALHETGQSPLVITVGLTQNERRSWGRGIAFAYNVTLTACKSEYISSLNENSTTIASWSQALQQRGIPFPIRLIRDSRLLARQYHVHLKTRLTHQYFWGPRPLPAKLEMYLQSMLWNQKLRVTTARVARK